MAEHWVVGHKKKPREQFVDIKSINHKAKLTAPKKKGAPIDSQGRLDLASLAAQRLNFLDQYNQQMADINRNYGVQRERAQQNEPYVQRGILSDYAGRGMAHSTGFGSAAGRETQLFNQNLSDLNYAHTYGMQDLNTQKLDFNRTLQQQQLAARQAAADRLSQQAGTLGLYTGKQKVTKQQASGILGIPQHAH